MGPYGKGKGGGFGYGGYGWCFGDLLKLDGFVDGVLRSGGPKVESVRMADKADQVASCIFTE